MGVLVSFIAEFILSVRKKTQKAPVSLYKFMNFLKVEQSHRDLNPNHILEYSARNQGIGKLGKEEASEKFGFDFYLFYIGVYKSICIVLNSVNKKHCIPMVPQYI